MAKGWWYMLLLWFAVATWPPQSTADVPITEFRPGTDRLDLASGVDVWIDATGATPVEALIQDDGSRFTPHGQDSLTFGFDQSIYWFRGRLKNVDHPESRWVLSIAYALLDDVELYLLTGEGVIETRLSGDRAPFHHRSLLHRHFNFGLELPPGQTVEFYLRVRSESSIQVPLQARTVTAFADDAYTAQLGLGLLYGILLALGLYNLVLFLSVRDMTYLYYVCYVWLFGLLQTALNGVSFQYFWPDHPDWANTFLLLVLALATLAMLQFCRSFVSLRRHSARLDLLVRAIMVFVGLTALGAFFLPYGLIVRVQTATVFLSTPCIFAAGVMALLGGYQPARYFLIAWTVLLLGILAYALVSFGLLPKVFITEYGIQIGSAAEMILLSFALAYRINVLTEENQEMAAEARLTLEERVDARTRELNQTLAQLESANQVLRESSERDGLTGVHNRRYLENLLRQEWDRARGRETPVSLVVMDLDHFKQVNDKRGHLAGDDCLKAVARALRIGVAHETAVVARYGGEEFFIVLPGWNPADAKGVAERLREAIAALEIESEDQSFSITASFGVATMWPRLDTDYRDLIREADLCMYEAKRKGRNRVVAKTPEQG